MRVNFFEPGTRRRQTPTLFGWFANPFSKLEAKYTPLKNLFTGFCCQLSNVTSIDWFHIHNLPYICNCWQYLCSNNSWQSRYIMFSWSCSTTPCPNALPLFDKTHFPQRCQDVWVVELCFDVLGWEGANFALIYFTCVITINQSLKTIRLQIYFWL